MAPPPDPAAGIDTSRPSALRVFDALSGGKDNFAADREMAARLEEACPDVRRLARAHRQFALDAAAWLASRGIRQFIQCGIPLLTRPYVHEAAREREPAVVVAYVTGDPVILAHTAALKSGPGLAAVDGDVRDPGAVLAAAELRAVIDLGQPCAVMLGGVLAGLDAGEAARAVREFAGPLAAGSCLVASCASYWDKQIADRIARIYLDCMPWHDHGQEAVTGFFAAAGLRDPDGGPVIAADAERWQLPYRRWAVAASPTRRPHVLGGVGIKPEG